MLANRGRWTTAFLTAFLMVGAVTVAQARESADPVEPPVDERFQKVVLEDSSLTQPMRIAPTPDGRLVYIERDGRVRVWDPDAQGTVTAGTVSVRVTGELGMVGLALAPDFASSGHIYLHFSPPDWPTSYVSRIARFTLSDDNVLDLDSETKIIDIQHPEGVSGGHSAGDMLMTDDGQLFIATGDNTDCCASNGFPGTDERPGHESGDAQRTSANTNDLNGKILRIIPKLEGGYTIPEGNLFDEAQDVNDKTRPEIYAMGFRNPFTIGDWDPETRTLWVADYGPDAVQPSEERGPAGHVRAFLISEPGNYGWPYCTMNNVPYNDWDYINDEPGPWFDCDQPVNDSPNNTGLVNLPPIKPATIYYTYDKQDYFPDLFGGGAMAGPQYEYDAANPSKTKFPEWFDGRRFLFDWTTDWVQTIHFTENGVPINMTEFLPDENFRKPMDMEFGPDGSLYVLEYGNGWGASNDDSGLYRIDYVEGNRTPLVKTEQSADSGTLPLTVEFDASASADPDGDALSFAWDFDSDGSADATGAQASHTFTEAGRYTPRVTVTDANGASSIGNLNIVAGNTRPHVTIESPVEGTWAEFGEDLPFKVTVTDPEDGTIDCTKVKVTYQLGHNQHGHPMGEATPNADCTGVLMPGRDAGHGPNAYVFHILRAEYTDGGGVEGAPALTGSDGTVLHPREYQGRNYQDGEGVALYYGQLFVPGSGNWFSFPTINLAGIDHLNMEFATREAGVDLTVHAGSPTGPEVARFDDIPDTGSTSLNDRVYKWLSSPVTNPGGIHDLYFVATWPSGIQPELFVRFFQFQTTPEVSANLSPAEPNGTNGWYTSDVEFTISANGNASGQPPLWNRQYSIDDGATWLTANDTVILTMDGEHKLLYRAIDAAGATTEIGTLGVEIDKTSPNTSITGIEDGATYGDSRVLQPTASVQDATSGIASVEAALDGTGIALGEPLELWRLALGSHELTVRVTDRAGNSTTRTTRLETTTSTADIAALIQLFEDTDRLPAGADDQLMAQLNNAIRHEKAGRLDQAITAMESFKKTTGSRRDIQDTEVRTVLMRDADAVIAQLHGQ